MTLAEIVAMLSNVANAVTGFTAVVADLQKRTAALEAQVAAHDKQLVSAPPPGQKG
jgi:hypothetical protein